MIRRMALALMSAGLLAAGCATQSASPKDRATTVIPAKTGDLGGYFDCLREKNLTIVAAHRLGGKDGLENSISAMATTRLMSIQGAPTVMEMDVRQTEDGALVIMHDEKVDRTTNGNGRVDAFPLEQFRVLRMKGAMTEAPPTLAEALEWGKDGIILQLDVKQGVPFEAVVAAVQGAGAQNRVIVITYSLADAISVHNLDPSLMLSVSIESVEELDTLARVGVDLSRVLAWTGIQAPRPALNRALRARGVEVLFGTLGPPATSIDSQIEAARTPSRYVDIAKTGVTMISTGRFRPATEAVLAGGVGDPLPCVRQ